MTFSRPSFAIVGAGMGGLAAAATLRRAGFAVHVYEQAHRFARIGAGIQMMPNSMKVLRARLYERELERQRAELDATRSSQIGTGSRAEKIRTYNFPENRLTDHRIKLTVHQLDRILGGELDEFTEALATDDRRRTLGE